MDRGRKRTHQPSIPAHIDQAAIPRGIYWDKTGNGRWYVLDTLPEGGRKAKPVAGRDARLSDLHAIAESRAGNAAAGSVTAVLDAFNGSLDFKSLAASTKEHYEAYAKAIKAYPTKRGPLGLQQVDALSQPFIRALINAIAQGKRAERKGEDDIPPYPTKANHWLRYLRRAFGWGCEYGACKTNPARGVRCVREVRAHRMPTLATFRAVQAFARQRGALGAREKGALPAYLWAAMELAYQPRLRGIEVLTLSDAYDLGDKLQTNRRKGSRDNLVRKGVLMHEAIDALRAYRKTVWERKDRQIPIRPEDRPLFVGEDGDRLTKDGFDTAFGRMMRAAVVAGVITAEERFGLHALKHRGATDTKGTGADKKDATGHKTDAMGHLYNHDLPTVEPADDLEFSGEFSGGA